MSDRKVGVGSMMVPARRWVGESRGLAKWIIFAEVGLAVVLALPACLHAQDNNGWLGKRVVPKYRNFQLRIENRFIFPQQGITYRVEQVDAPWLRLRAEGRSLNGWALADKVVPIEEAIDFFTNYIRVNPKDPFGYIERADIWQREEKELDIALSDLDEAIRLDSRNVSAYNDRGLIWHEKREYNKAIADFEKAIRLDPKNDVTYANRGDAYNAKKEWDKALADYSRAIRLNPKNAVSYNNRGSSWWHKKEYDKAIADYNEAIRLDPKDGAAYNNRGTAWRDKKEYDKAIADFSEAIRLDPESAVSYSNRGTAWRDKKEYDKAIADYQRGDPNSTQMMRSAYDDRGNDLVREEGIRQGHRRFLQGDPTRPK